MHTPFSAVTCYTHGKYSRKREEVDDLGSSALEYSFNLDLRDDDPGFTQKYTICAYAAGMEFLTFCSTLIDSLFEATGPVSSSTFSDPRIATHIYINTQATPVNLWRNHTL